MNKKEKELKNLMRMKDSSIDYSDIPEVKSFRGWQSNPYFKPIKKPVSFRMDADLLAWFQEQPKYTHLINEACRLYMLQTSGVKSQQFNVSNKVSEKESPYRLKVGLKKRAVKDTVKKTREK